MFSHNTYYLFYLSLYQNYSVTDRLEYGVYNEHSTILLGTKEIQYPCKHVWANIVFRYINISFAAIR